MSRSMIKAGFIAVACMWGAFANAGAITCQPSNERVATLDDAVLCATRNGPNANISTPADVDALIDAFTPQALVWASDWPFLRAPARIDYGPLQALARDWLPDATDRRAVLWDTPRRLFGFGH